MRSAILKVLIACEFSGRVRDAFRAKGHDAWSCDLVSCEGDKLFHIQGDVLPLLNCNWDLIIAHPPCTYLSSAGLHWNNKIKSRQLKTERAFDFFMKMYNAPCYRVCVENPVGYVGTHFRKANQIINPFQFGHSERKRTCLWLKGLPPLVSTKEVEPEESSHIDSTTGKKRYSLDYLPGNADRPTIRSRTFQGIANAMADQWG